MARTSVAGRAGVLVCALAAGLGVVSCGGLDDLGAESSPTATVTVPVTPSPVPASPSPASSPPSTPTPDTFSRTYAAVHSGVVRIDVQGCEDSGSGTGFLIEPDLVATVAHVVSGSATVRITQETRSVSAEVLGLDESSDTALIRTSRPLEGHVFEFSPDGPVVGERIGVIGFPAGDTGLIDSAAGSKSFKEGSVNGLDRKAEVEGLTRTSLVELDALARSGNSGSPVIEVDGDVVGLLSAGPSDADAARARLAVSSEIAVPLLDRWASGTEPVPPADCSGAVDPDGQPVPFAELPGGESTEAAATLNLFFKSINQADYSTAYAQFHPDVQKPDGLEAFAEGVKTSNDTDVVYRNLSRSGRDLVVWTTFRSTQDAAYGPDGLTCADWSLDYTLRQSDRLWLIVGSKAHEAGLGYTECIEGE